MAPSVLACLTLALVMPPQPLVVHRLPPNRAAVAMMRGSAPPKQQTMKPEEDWGGLPGAVAASRCGAINHQLVQARDADAVLALISKHEANFNAVNVGTALHRIAYQLKRSRAQRDRVLRDKRFASLIESTVERAGDFNPRSVSDVLWACATLQHWPPEMLKPILTQVAKHLESSSFEAQHLSITVWALAMLQCKPVRLLERIEELTLHNLPSFNTQNCANVLWGFAKLNYVPSALLPAISTQLAEVSFLAEMKPVEISDVAFAIALVGSREEHEPLMLALATRADVSALLAQFSSRQLVTLTWSFARLEIQPPQLTDWLSRIEEAHASTPLLAQDQRNLQAALSRYAEGPRWAYDDTWLQPPPKQEAATA